jgi:hypothetical protein
MRPGEREFSHFLNLIGAITAPMRPSTAKLARRRSEAKVDTLRCMTQNQNAPEGQRRNMSGWIRIAYAAKAVGVHPDTLARWIKRGEVPLSMRKLGPRLIYVNAPQFFRWRGISAPYTAEDVARANEDCERGWRREERVNYFTGKPRTLDEIIIDGMPASEYIRLAQERRNQK